MNERFVYEEREHVAFVKLNSSSTSNVIDSNTAQDLLEACRRISENDDLNVVVITGSGNVFSDGSALEQLVCSGVPLSEAASKLGEDAVRFEVAAAIGLIDRPVIAAINGNALGQGLEIALACDIRVCSETTRIGFPSVAFGLMPMDGGTQRLPRLVGKGRALELILRSETINAKEALDIGLVSQVVPQEQLLENVMVMARAMAAKAPISLRYVKEAVNKGMDMTLDQGVRLEADLYFLIHTTEDRTEGIRAFQEKRKPKFQGK
jgi:enoyl-CoA hydratase/carnithine racemase